MAQHSSLGEFGKAFKRKGAVLERETSRLLRETAIGVVTEVARDTPIDTGQAQSNWLTRLNAPFPYYIWNEDDNGAWHEAVDFAQNVLKNVKTTDVIHITNSLPYIAQLNRGTSRQAPKLFVQMAVLRAAYAIKGFKVSWT